jgi:hypothetical protein
LSSINLDFVCTFEAENLGKLRDAIYNEKIFLIGELKIPLDEIIDMDSINFNDNNPLECSFEYKLKESDYQGCDDVRSQALFKLAGNMQLSNVKAFIIGILILHFFEIHPDQSSCTFTITSYFSNKMTKLYDRM